MKLNNNFIYSILTAAVTLACQSQSDLQLPQLNCNEKFKSTSSMAKTIALPTGYITQDMVSEAYISATNTEGNFGQTIYVQDLPQSPNLGLKINLSVANIHNDYPLGSKISLKLKGLYLEQNANGYSLWQGPNKAIAAADFHNITARACLNDKPAVSDISPVLFTSIADAKRDQYLGQLIQINKLNRVGIWPKDNPGRRVWEFAIQRSKQSPEGQDKERRESIKLLFDDATLLEEKFNQSFNQKEYGYSTSVNIKGILVKQNGQYYLKPRYISDCVDVTL
jgi:Family of unknown function (DUF5689)